jgi:hypothetical protein
MFDLAPSKSQEKKRSIRLSGINKKGKPRDSIVDVLLTLFELEQGITGFKWDVSSQDVEVSYVKGFLQRDYSDNKEDLIDMLLLILKSRKNILSIEWNFKEEFVTLVVDE